MTPLLGLQLPSREITITDKNIRENPSGAGISPYAHICGLAGSYSQWNRGLPPAQVYCYIQPRSSEDSSILAKHSSGSSSRVLCRHLSALQIGTPQARCRLGCRTPFMALRLRQGNSVLRVTDHRLWACWIPDQPWPVRQ